MYYTVLKYKLLIFKTVALATISATFLINLYSIETNDSIRIKILYDSSMYYYEFGNYLLTVNNLKEVLKIKEKLKSESSPEYFKIYNTLGVSYKKQGDLEQAIYYYKKALENNYDESFLPIINSNIANIYTLKGDFQKAIIFYDNSLNALQKYTDTKKYVRLYENYHNQAYLYNKLGNYQLSIKKSLKSIQIAKQHNIIDIGNTLYICGISYEKLDSIKLAEKYYKDAIITNKRNHGEQNILTILSHIYLARFYSNSKNYFKAIQLYNKVYTSLISNVGSKHPYTSFYYSCLGNMFFSKNDYKQAILTYQKALISKIPEFNDSSIYQNPSLSAFPDIDLLNILKAKAKTLEKLSESENREVNLKMALNTLELSAKFIEQLRSGYFYEESKLVLTEKEHETYTSIIDIAFTLFQITQDKSYLAIAFNYSEQSKYAVLRELNNEELARDAAALPDSITELEYRIKEQIGNTRLEIENGSKLLIPDSTKIARLKVKLFQLNQTHEELQKTLEQDYPKYYKRKYDNYIVKIPELQKVLTEKEVLLSYELTYNLLYTFFVSKDTFYMTRQVIDSLFYKNLETFTGLLHSEYIYNYIPFRVSSYGLYNKLVEPFAAQLRGKNLLVSPCSELSQIAFEALMNQPFSEGESADKLKDLYIINNYPIGYANSATLFYNSKQRKKAWNPHFLGFAPDYKNSRDSLEYLPSVSENLRRIVWWLRGKAFTREDATEQNLKKYIKDCGILHLYTYGYEDPQRDPSFSKIFLSYKNDTVEDGYLYAYEVDELETNAELVVLASCYSGSGVIKKGEGALSMGRKFLISGTPSIIVSLWAAYYEPTLFEMKEFYKQLALGKRKDEALRFAKLKYLESANPVTAHPRYWTSLIVVGNQDALYRGYFIWTILKLIVFLSVPVVIFIYFKKKKFRSKKMRLF